VGGSPGREDRAVGDEQAGHVVRLAPPGDHAVLGPFAHATGAHVVGRGVRRRAHAPGRADALVDGLALVPGVLPHGNVIGMVVEVDVGGREPVLVGDVAVQGDAVGL